MDKRQREGKIQMRKKRKKIKFIFLFSVLAIVAVLLIPLALKSENLRGIKDKVEEAFNGGQFKDSYNAKSLIMTGLSNDEDFIYKCPEEQQLPASLAKLYVIEYASTFVELEDVIWANPEALALTKEGSSVANIEAKSILFIICLRQC